MGQAPHEWPKPAWREAEDGTIEHGHFNSAADMKEKMQPKDSEHLDAGWTDRWLPSVYPRALHGPDGQSVSVKNKAEEKTALAKGWTLKPHVDEDTTEVEVVRTHTSAPKPKKGIDAPRPAEA